MLLSVFTPSHRPVHLDDAYMSLASQTHTDWEWGVLLNGGCQWTPPEDSRVRVIEAHDAPPLVGALKRAAVTACTGDLLVELDHDDTLVSTALEKVLAAHEANPRASLIYSDTAQVNEHGQRDDTRWGQGWEYDEVTVDGQDVLRCRSLAPLPHNVGLIWYAPNHVRAFPRWAYTEAGGYDASLRVLDDQDLMRRLYGVGEFVHLEEVLYLQRVGVGNTQADTEINALIQVQTVDMYEQHIGPIALSWCDREGLLPLDLGAAHGAQPGYLGVDLVEGPGVHFVGDVFDVLGKMEDNSVGVIRAFDFLEHIETIASIRLLNECYRVLAHGGMLLTATPSTDGRGAWQDPTHVSGWNENRWWYFTDQEYAAFVPDITCRFHTGTVRSYFPSDFHRAHHIPYVLAFLSADKGGPRLGGIPRWS